MIELVASDDARRFEKIIPHFWRPWTRVSSDALDGFSASNQRGSRRHRYFRARQTSSHLKKPGAVCGELTASRRRVCRHSRRRSK
jgi:hypothetical protein